MIYSIRGLWKAYEQRTGKLAWSLMPFCVLMHNSEDAEKVFAIPSKVCVNIAANGSLDIPTIKAVVLWQAFEESAEWQIWSFEVLENAKVLLAVKFVDKFRQ